MTDEKTIPGGVVHDLSGDLQEALQHDSKALPTWEITTLAFGTRLIWLGNHRGDRFLPYQIES